MAIKKSDLYSSLWQSCDELRGGMDASQYKDYVLVLLFVKYISDKNVHPPPCILQLGSLKRLTISSAISTPCRVVNLRFWSLLHVHSFISHLSHWLPDRTDWYQLNFTELIYLDYQLSLFVNLERWQIIFYSVSCLSLYTQIKYLGPINYALLCDFLRRIYERKSEFF